MGADATLYLEFSVKQHLWHVSPNCQIMPASALSFHHLSLSSVRVGVCQNKFVLFHVGTQ
jgi:hypothetical protein